MRRSRAHGRVVRFLADGACSDYTTIPTLPGSEDEVRREIAQWIGAEAGRSWDTFILTGVSGVDELMMSLGELVQEHNVLLDRRTIGNAWRVSLPATWDEYVDQYSKRDRYRLRRVKREMFDSGRAVMRRVVSPADLEQGYEIQYRLRQLRCDSQGELSCFADLRFTAFLREASRRFLERDQLRLQWTEVDGEPVAFDSGFVDQGGVYVYQTAFDPAKADLSPGRLHLQASIAHAIDEGHQFFDFLRGDEPYKRHFRATAIPLWEMRLVAPRVVPRLGYQVWKLHKQAKAGARRLLRRRGASAAASPNGSESTAVALRRPSPSTARSDGSGKLTRLGKLTDECRRFGVSSAASGLAYRVVRRIGRVRRVHVLSLDIAELPPQPALPRAFEWRWLTPSEVRDYAADEVNDLDAAVEKPGGNGDHSCCAVLIGSRLVNYCWYAVGSIEAEHSFGLGLSLPSDTLFLYKAFTHPDFRGRGFHPIGVSRAIESFAQRGISRVIALVENDNWPSLISHAKLGFRRAGRLLVGGRGPLTTRRYPSDAMAMGIRFGHQA
jgi:CelD/BcsL family acetyltransferase involved in cellulose biosynthesis